MKNFSVFKNYDSGEIASRLYIKNLAKHTTEQVKNTNLLQNAFQHN